MKILVDVGVIEVRVGSTGGMFVKSDIVPRALLEQRSRLRLSEVRLSSKPAVRWNHKWLLWLRCTLAPRTSRRWRPSSQHTVHPTALVC